MADISKCEGENCDVKENCYRYLAEANPNRQSFIKPTEPGFDCEFYWPEHKVEQKN